MKRDYFMRCFSFITIVLMLILSSNSVVYAGKPSVVTGVDITTRDISETILEGTAREFEVIAKYGKSKVLSWSFSSNLVIISGPIKTTKQEKVMVAFTGKLPGPYAEKVTVTDGNGFSDTFNADIIIEGSSPVNNPPTAEDLILSTNEDEIISGEIIATDTDGDSLTAQISTNPANGTADILGLIITYTPNPNFAGSDSFTVVISDGKGGLDTAEVLVNVSSADDLPVAVNDIASTDMNTAVNIYVLANDTDIDNGIINIESVSAVTNGVANPMDSNSDGFNDYVIFTPDSGIIGTGGFLYTLNGGSNAAVSVTITGAVEEPLKYVALGDSIPYGTYYTSLWDYLDGGTDSYSYVEQSAAYLNVESASFVDASVSGYNTVEVFNQIDSITETIRDADIITLCVGANDIMDAAARSYSGLQKYSIDWNIADSGRDSFEYYWWRLIDKIENLNPDVNLIVMTIYNPYRTSDSYYKLVDPYFTASSGDDLGLNYIIENTLGLYDYVGNDIFSDTFNYEVVDIYKAFNEDPNKDSLTGFYNSFCDPHPNQSGQNLIYAQHTMVY